MLELLPVAPCHSYETRVRPPDTRGPRLFWADQEHLPAAHVLGRGDPSIALLRLAFELDEFGIRQLIGDTLDAKWESFVRHYLAQKEA